VLSNSRKKRLSASEFLSVDIAGEPKPLEHDQLRWATVEELEILPLAPSDRAFVQSVLLDGI
jgi:hypothetical protein